MTSVLPRQFQRDSPAATTSGPTHGAIEQYDWPTPTMDNKPITVVTANTVVSTMFVSLCAAKSEHPLRIRKRKNLASVEKVAIDGRGSVPFTQHAVTCTDDDRAGVSIALQVGASASRAARSCAHCTAPVDTPSDL